MQTMLFDTVVAVRNLKHGAGFTMNTIQFKAYVFSRDEFVIAARDEAYMF